MDQVSGELRSRPCAHRPDVDEQRRPQPEWIDASFIGLPLPTDHHREGTLPGALDAAGDGGIDDENAGLFAGLAASSSAVSARIVEWIAMIVPRFAPPISSPTTIGLDRRRGP